MILEAIVAAKRRAHAARDRQADRRARDRVGDLPPARPFAEALAGGGGQRALAPSVIAELKRRSPSAGEIRPDADAQAIALDYQAGGARALSILTDRELFGGCLEDLEAARAAVPLPLLRKDFVLFEEDLADARLAGADAVLLIVRLLDGDRLPALLAHTAALGLDALVEVHDDDECRRALDAGARLIGVNHRDLDTLAIDLALSERLAPAFPPSVTRVAESGLANGAALARVRDLGYHAVLVGEALMRAPSPGQALAALLADARAR